VGVAVAPDGTVYAADVGNNRIQAFDATGTFLSEWATEGSGAGGFVGPEGLAVVPDGRIYVADWDDNRIQVFEGEWGSAGSGPGQFDGPSAVAVAPDGQTVYVADALNHRIQAFCVPLGAEEERLPPPPAAALQRPRGCQAPIDSGHPCVLEGSRFCASLVS
jgi:DNA-binding beta-propeller fold protein YncE